MEILNMVQGTPEWIEARLGICTASRFSDVLAGGQGKTRSKYMRQLVAERISGLPTENYSNAYMERGHEWEDEARMFYSLMKEVECEQVGFIRDGDKGASPDALIDKKGALEIKTRTGEIQINTILTDKVPSENIAQIQGIIWIGDLEWCDYCSYSKGLPLFVKRVYRDDKYINGTLWPGVERFIEEMHEMVRRLK